MYVDQKSVYEMSLIAVRVNEMSVDKMSADEMAS
jgi:hypothetical protein